MEFLNKIELCGVVGRSSTTAVGNTTVCNFSLCVEHCYKGDNGCITIDTLWMPVIACGPKPGWPDFDKIQKGSKVKVIGRLRAKRFTDNNGCDRTYNDVVAQELKLLEG